MPNRTDTTGHSKAFICSHGPLGGSQSAPAQGRFEPPTCQSTVEHTNHQTTMTAPSRRIDYTSGPQKGGGGLLPIGRIVCENSPATCRTSSGSQRKKETGRGARCLGCIPTWRRQRPLVRHCDLYVPHAQEAGMFRGIILYR